MKRLLAFYLIALFAWSALPTLPAGANVAELAIDCDEVTVSWSRFPERDVMLNLKVTQGDEQTLASVSTEGEPAGSASVPVELDTGEASAVVHWTLPNGSHHKAGPVTATLDCPTPPTTTTPTTEPSPTTTVPDVTTVPTEPPPTTATPVTEPELPNTGSTSALFVLGGLGMVAVGSACIAGSRRINQ